MRITTKIFHKTYFNYLILTVIVILGFLVRLYKLNNPIADWHSWRQADTASVSLYFFNHGVDLLHPRYQDISSVASGAPNLQGYRFVEFPILNALHAGFARAFPQLDFDLWGRLISVIFSTASILSMYYIGSYALGKKGGLLSAFFFAFIPFNIYFSRVVLPEPAIVSLCLLSISLFIVWVRRGTTLFLFLSAIVFGTALLLKPYSAFYLIPLLYLAVKKKGVKGILGDVRMWVFLDLAVIPLLLWRAWTWNYLEGVAAWQWAFNGDGIRFRPAFWRWIFGERIGYLILGIWGLVPFVFGILSMKRKQLLSFSFGIGSFIYLAVVATANVRHDYYQALIIPAVCLFLAQGVIAILSSKEFNKVVGLAIVLFSILFMLMMGTYQVKEFYKINHPEIIEAGKEIDKIAPHDAKVIAPYNGDTAFLYQTRRSGWPVNDSTIDELISRGASYYVSVNYSDPDTQDVMKRFKIVKKTDKYVIANLLERN